MMNADDLIMVLDDARTQADRASEAIKQGDLARARGHAVAAYNLISIFTTLTEAEECTDHTEPHTAIPHDKVKAMVDYIAYLQCKLDDVFPYKTFKEYTDGKYTLDSEGLVE